MAVEKAELMEYKLTSKTSLFGFPYCVKDINIDKINATYTPNRIWYSNTLSSYRGVTNTDQESVSYIMSNVKEFTDSVIPFEYKLKLVSFWANEYYEKDFQEAHLHGNSDFSFVIFKKIGKANGLLFFSPAYDLLQTSSLWQDRAMKFKDTVECDAKEGQIVIFPSILRHMVLPNKEKEVRITYTGNVQIIYKNKTVNGVEENESGIDLSIMKEEY